MTHFQHDRRGSNCDSVNVILIVTAELLNTCNVDSFNFSLPLKNDTYIQGKRDSFSVLALFIFYLYYYILAFLGEYLIHHRFTVTCAVHYFPVAC